MLPRTFYGDGGVEEAAYGSEPPSGSHTPFVNTTKKLTCGLTRTRSGVRRNGWTLRGMLMDNLCHWIDKCAPQRRVIFLNTMVVSLLCIAFFGGVHRTRVDRDRAHLTMRRCGSMGFSGNEGRVTAVQDTKDRDHSFQTKSG